MFGGKCNEVLWMLDVFFLKIVCKSFFLGVIGDLFFGVILFIRILLGWIFVLI